MKQLFHALEINLLLVLCSFVSLFLFPNQLISQSSSWTLLIISGFLSFFCLILIREKKKKLMCLYSYWERKCNQVLMESNRLLLRYDVMMLHSLAYVLYVKQLSNQFMEYDTQTRLLLQEMDYPFSKKSKTRCYTIHQNAIVLYQNLSDVIDNLMSLVPTKKVSEVIIHLQLGYYQDTIKEYSAKNQKEFQAIVSEYQNFLLSVDKRKLSLKVMRKNYELDAMVARKKLEH